VTHNTKPFVNRVRYAPEVASRPDRLRKDLANVKALAAVMEDEYAKARAFKPEKKPVEGESAEGENAAKDAVMGDAQEEEEEEPKERGSDAVERKVGRLMDDFVQAGLIDPANEKAFEAKKVSHYCILYHYPTRLTL
jgi:hypothetical protein